MQAQEKQAQEKHAREKQARDANINLRVTRRQKALIDQAADSLGVNRTDFVVGASCREAEAVLLDRRHFLLEEGAYEAFVAALDAPPRDHPGLRDLLGRLAPWDK
ncbi:MAG: DUF1778 domain-containing protein [Tistlia sp.]|uniref:DUF1778 domain-containing protein n=1 Tax=Tistlia sp. TaxID=3057121 RepID=UPI0034A4E062